MLFFANDYGYGAHPEVLSALCDTNGEPLTGYGSDPYSRRAEEKIRAFLHADESKVVFVSGGTQVNVLALQTLVNAYEAVLCPETGHIHVHEAGALEACGHKIIVLPCRNGKIDAETLSRYLERFYKEEAWEHAAQPGALYLSQPTEMGTLYSLRELKDIRAICAEYQLKMFIDGARMAYGLGSPQNDVRPEDLPGLADAFTLGGTKCGALCGEALVYSHGAPPHLVSQVKRMGALMAKGRLMGVQFDALFTNDLYLRIGRETAEKTQKLHQILEDKGYRFAFPSPTNQQFVYASKKDLEAFEKQEIVFARWEASPEGENIIRFCVSFATRFEDLERLKERLPEASSRREIR